MLNGWHNYFFYISKQVIIIYERVKNISAYISTGLDLCVFDHHKF